MHLLQRRQQEDGEKGITCETQFSRPHRHILRSTDFKNLSTPKTMLGCPVFAWRLSLNVTYQTDVETAHEPVLRIRIRDGQAGSYFLELRNHFFGLKYLKSLMRIRDGKNSDPGWKKVGSGIRDREKHPGSATLLGPLIWYKVFYSANIIIII